MSLKRVEAHRERHSLSGGKCKPFKGHLHFPVNCKVFKTRVLHLVIMDYINPPKLPKILHRVLCRGVWSSKQGGDRRRQEGSQFPQGLKVSMPQKGTDIIRFTYDPRVSWGQWIQKGFGTEGIALASFSILDCSKLIIESRGDALVDVDATLNPDWPRERWAGQHQHHLGLQDYCHSTAPVFTFPYILNLFWSLASHSLSNRQVHSCSIQPTVASSLEAINTNQNK